MNCAMQRLLSDDNNGEFNIYNYKHLKWRNKIKFYDQVVIYVVDDESGPSSYHTDVNNVENQSDQLKHVSNKFC